MKKIICLLLLFTGLFSIVGCSSADTLPTEKLVIATSPDYAPFEFVDTNKSGSEQYVGADIELMKYIAKEMGLELEIKTVDFDTTLALLSAGTVDLAISGFTYKESRAAQYLFSDPYSNEGTQGILVKKDSQYKTLADVNKEGVTVLGQSGSVQYDYISTFLPNATPAKFAKVGDALVMLDNNNGQAVALSSEVADIIVASNPDKYVFLDETFDVSSEETKVFVLAQKGKTKLIGKVNEIIAKVNEEGLYKTWWGQAIDLAIQLGEI